MIRRGFDDKGPTLFSWLGRVGGVCIGGQFHTSFTLLHHSGTLGLNNRGQWKDGCCCGQVNHN